LANNGGPTVNEYCETTISGIFACGNVLQVHDLVDWVSAEAERAGENAAKFSKGEIEMHKGDSHTLSPGWNVGYVKPERLDNLSSEKVVEISFRVKVPQQNVRIDLITEGKIIYSRKSKFVIPSEMNILKIKLNPEFIGKEITINVLELLKGAD